MLNNEQKREIHQLWFVAEQYYNLAKEVIKDCPRDYLKKEISQIKKHFSEDFPTDKNIINITMMIAHLASSAVRLVTINERAKYNFTNNYLKNSNSTKKLTEEEMREKHIHQYLRDNVAHSENDAKEPKYIERQEALEEMTPQEIFDSIKKVIDDYRRQLQEKGILKNGDDDKVMPITT